MENIKNCIKTILFAHVLFYAANLSAAAAAPGIDESVIDETLVNIGCYKGGAPLTALATSHGGEFLVHEFKWKWGQRYDHFKFWNMQSRICTRDLEIDCLAWALAISPNGNILASGGQREVALWNLKLGKNIHKFEVSGCVEALAFNSDGNILASGDDSGEVSVWNLTTMERIHTIKCSGSVDALAFNLYDNILVYCGPCLLGESRLLKGLGLLDLGKDTCIPLFELWPVVGHCYATSNAVAFSSDGSLFAIACENRDNDGKIELWDMQSKTCIHTFKYGDGYVFKIAFSPDGMQIAAMIVTQNGFNGSEVRVVIWTNLPAQRITQERKLQKRQMLTLALVQHPRLGENSPAQSLSELPLRMINEIMIDDMVLPTWQEVLGR